MRTERSLLFNSLALEEEFVVSQPGVHDFDSQVQSKHEDS